VLTYESETRCREGKNYSLDIKVNCNQDVFRTKYQLGIEETSEDPCHPLIIMESPHGCPVFTTGALALHNQSFWWVNAICMTLFGLYLLVSGGRYPQATLFLFCTAAIGNILTVIMFTFIFPEFLPKWTVIMMYILNYGIGAGLGLGAIKWPSLGVCVSGAILGLLIG
jgi:hypothetical protein